MRTTVAALLLVVAGLLTGCDGSACEEVDRLQEQLDDTSPNDNEYYEISDELNRARAECNAE